VVGGQLNEITWSICEPLFMPGNFSVPSITAQWREFPDCEGAAETRGCIIFSEFRQRLKPTIDH
jgi:hypothetical protein